MKLFFAMICMFFTFAFAKANVASSEGDKGEEVSCDINASLVKDKGGKVKSRPSLDMRFVTLPALKLSGKKIILNDEGQTIQCRNFYSAVVDDNLLVSACSDHKQGEDLDIKEIYFMYLKEPENREQKGYIAEGNGTRKYFCTPKKSGGTNSKPSDTKNTSGTK